LVVELPEVEPELLVPELLVPELLVPELLVPELLVPESVVPELVPDATGAWIDVPAPRVVPAPLVDVW
jgi:hypothetical protein